ncbi:MAG: fimbrillin family protein [Prevotella sp.]|nr:fimbrillin family protein [Prevotella sp.]
MRRHKEMITAAILLSLMACSQQDTESLLETLEPVVLKAVVASPVEATRGTTATTSEWAEHDQVAVRIDNEVKIYEASHEDGGTLRAAAAETPFYWRTRSETKTVAGWYLGNGRRLREMPTEWTVAGNQHTNEGEGMEQSDFLYATPTGITYTDRFHAQINFYHQTSKIMVRIRNEGAIKGDTAAIEQVTIGNASYPIVMRASFEEPATTSYGSWTLSRRSEDLGYIIPHVTVFDSVSTYLKYYEALVIPDNLDHKPLLAITLGGHTYYYIPQENQARLTPGHLFVYDIGVSVDSTKLVVTPMVGDNLVWSWQDDGTVDENDDKDATLQIQGWQREDNPDANITSGVIPLEISANGWRKEGEGSALQEDSQPEYDHHANGWKKDGDNEDATHTDQPDGMTVGNGTQWTKEGEDEAISSE